jgi:hypothetical protein
MTLAAILLLGIAGMAPAPAGPFSAQPWTSPQATSTPSQPANAGAQTPAAGQSSSSPQESPKPAPKKIHHKKLVASDCVKAASPANSQSASSPGPDPTSDTRKQTTSAANNCPPSKVIVRQGGTDASNVQLAGGPGGDEATQKRNVVNQLLGLTEANLKKIEGRQLAPNEQDTVTQIHQFSDQSHAALDAGDLERARVLAWKAELLSEDLVNPKK